MVKTPNNPNRRFLRACEVAVAIGCSERHVHRLVERGELSPVRIGRMLRFHAADIDHVGSSRSE